MSVVVDASAIAAVVFEEPERANVLALLRGHALYAPPMIELEMPNIYLKKLRRHRLEATKLKQSLMSFFALPIQIEPIDLSAVLMTAEAHSLSFYDACYLQLARDLSMPLITLDKKLASTAGSR